MSRPIRIEFGGALYHVTARGNRREAIYVDDTDRERFLAVLGGVVNDFNWVCHAWCLMTNHYHLLIETPDGNLSKGMRQLNGVYTQASNRRHGRVGHLFQGRYKAILVDNDSYLLELARYVVLNPVRARMVENPGDWSWSSYRAMTGQADRPAWLAVDGLLAAFGQRRLDAAKGYARFVHAGMGDTSVWSHLKGQAFLGDDAFVERCLRHAKTTDDVNLPRAQRRAPPEPLAEIERSSKSRDEAIVAAHASGGYSYADIGRHFGLHFTHVGRIVRRHRTSQA